MTETDRLASAADALGLTLSETQASKLVGYLDLLEAWNRTYNLTAVRERPDMLVQHLFDCLAVIGPLRKGAAFRDSLPHSRLLDVGSGGGLPGIVIAVMCPQVDVVCVDTVGKKASFVRQVALELGIANLTAEHARVENLKLPGFELITSRAFASLSDFVRLTEKLLVPNGCWVAMKGVVPEPEIGDLPAAVEVFHVEQLAVPELDAARCLVWMKRKNESIVSGA